MIASNQMKGMTVCRMGRGLPLGLWLLLLGLTVTWMAGCQGPASAPKTPAVARQSEAAAPAPQSKTEAAKPAPAEVQTQPVKPAEANVAAGAPKITVEKDICDLGDIGVGTKHKGQFKFTNTGAAPLKMTLVQSCCGVTIKGVEVGQQYAPGQTGILDFDYQAPDGPSPSVVRKLYLQTNDPDQKVTTLTIKSAVVRRIICKPEVLKLLLKKSNAGCQEIVLTSLNDQPFSITDFKATAGTITAEFKPGVKATEFVLQPKVDMAKLEQNMRGQISIDLTHPDCNNVRVLYDTLPEFEVTPPMLTMFGLKAGQAVQREIWILSNYQDDFEIESATSPKGTIKLVDKTKASNRYQLRIEVTPPTRKPEETLTSDVLEIKIKNGPTLSIPFRGFYQ